jgi:hypothetical protein
LSIASALGVVLYVAIILSALKSGSNDGFKLIYTATFVGLIYATIAARFRGPFWFGFAVTGWAFFLVGFGAWIDGSAETGRQRVVNRSLLTHIVPELVPFVVRPPPIAAGNPMSSAMIRDNERASRDGIAHCFVTVICATLGGYGSRRMARSVARRPNPSATDA